MLHVGSYFHARHNEPSTRELTLHYITALAGTHEDFRNSFLILGAVQWIEACEALAHTPGEEHWSALCAPSTTCLEVLIGPHHEQCYVGPYLLDYLGFGPNALTQRLSVYLIHDHIDEHGCTPQSFPVTEIRDIWAKAVDLRRLDIRIEIISSALCIPCPSCNRPVSFGSRTDEIRHLLLRLFGFTKLSESDHDGRPSSNTALFKSF